MGGRLFGYRRSSTSTTTADVSVTDYDDSWGLDSINTPVAYQKAWSHQDITIFGSNYNIPLRTWVDCSCVNSDNTYMVGTAVSSLTVSSNSNADKYPWTGITPSGGVQAVRLEYLDANWAQQTIDIQLSGNKPTYATDVFRPQRMYAIKVGKSGAAIGNINLCYSGNQYLRIKNGDTISHNGFYYVAAGKELMLTDAFSSPLFGCISAIDFAMYKEEPYTFEGTTNYVESQRPMGQTVATYIVMNTPHPVTMPYTIDEKCRVRLRVIAGTAGSSGQSYVRGYLVDKLS